MAQPARSRAGFVRESKAPAKFSRWFKFLLLAYFALIPSLACCAQYPVDLGVLTPFYRSTQVQGHLFGMELTDIPDYLFAADIDFQYKKRPGAQTEIPFTDSFVINRFLGGYREDWLRKSHHWDDRLGLRSLDYATRGSDGKLQFRPDLIRGRLAPYLAAGYRPSDITIALENIPGDVAKPADSANAPGPWGQREPPADFVQWTAVIQHFAQDLKAYLGPEAAALSFETGVEYDNKVSFDGTSADFFNYYSATDRGIRLVFPDAHIGPGEFTGTGTCEASVTACVYDTRDFLAFTKANHLTVNDVPRSLYSLANRPGGTPSAVVARAELSYARLPDVVKEIHQFGLLSEPFGRDEGNDPAAREASWDFQALIGLWQTIKPRRVFHWGTFETVGQLHFLNGAGYLSLVLDHYLGYRAFRLSTGEFNSQIPAPGTELMAVGLTNPKTSAVIVSSFSAQLGATRRTVTVDLPGSVLSGNTALKAVRFGGSDNVFALIRDDLKNDNNLKPEFTGCPLCLGRPMTMANDPDRARLMLVRNWSHYVAEMKKGLKWTLNAPGVLLVGRQLRAQLEPNELLVLEPV